MAKKIRLGFLASYNGSSMQAIVNAIAQKELYAEAAVVVSNNVAAKALSFARNHQIPEYHLSQTKLGSAEALDRALCQVLQSHQVDFVILSGWMKKIGVKTLAAFKNKILNSHPALFSSPYKGEGYYGDYVHQSVLAAGEKETGVTIHLVDDQYDHGLVLAEERVQVKSTDTVDSLKERVQIQERLLYIAVLKKLIAESSGGVLS